MLFSELPKELQDVASHAVQNHMRKSSTGSEPGSPITMSSPKILSPGISPLRDGVDQEEVYKSLRKTTAEIQNYSFETLGNDFVRDISTPISVFELSVSFNFLIIIEKIQFSQMNFNQ